MIKTKALFPFLMLTLFILLAIPQHVQAQSVNWVALQSDTTAITTPGQVINVALDGSLNVPITGAAMSLRYDPACLRVISHHPGTLIQGAVVYAQAQAGQFDLAYNFPGSGRGDTGQGSLITVQMEALKICASDLSVAPNTILLGVLDTKGVAAALPGVQYRTLTLHLAPSVAASLVPVAAPVSQHAAPDINYMIFWSFIFPALVIGAIYLLLRRRSRKAGIISPIFGTLPGHKTPALIYNGRALIIPSDGTKLGRHTEIIKRDGCFYLVDNGSRNGTFLNGHPLGSDYYLLNNGDDIQLGLGASYRFVETVGRPAKSFSLKWLN